jgi:hypothetical protein
MGGHLEFGVLLPIFKAISEILFGQNNLRYRYITMLATKWISQSAYSELIRETIHYKYKSNEPDNCNSIEKLGKAS